MLEEESKWCRIRVRVKVKVRDRVRVTVRVRVSYVSIAVRVRVRGMSDAAYTISTCNAQVKIQIQNSEFCLIVCHSISKFS